MAAVLKQKIKHKKPLLLPFFLETRTLNMFLFFTRPKHQRLHTIVVYCEKPIRQGISLFPSVKATTTNNMLSMVDFSTSLATHTNSSVSMTTKDQVKPVDQPLSWQRLVLTLFPNVEAKFACKDNKMASVILQ